MPDTDTDIEGGSLRKSSSEYNESEESSSEEESSLGQARRTGYPTEVLGLPGSDYGEKETDAMDKNSPEPTVTQNQRVEPLRPDEKRPSHNSKKSSSQPVCLRYLIGKIFQD